MQTTRERVVAFRVRRHHLGRRSAASALAEAVAVCGIRNSPPGSAAAALAARVNGLDPETVPAAVAAGTLVEVLGPRLAPTLVVAADLPVFTRGAMPADDAALRETIGEQAAKELLENGISFPDAVEMVSAAARDELAGGPRTRGSLSAALTRRLPEVMSSWCERCGSRHVYESLFRIPGGTGVYCVQPRSGREISFVRADQLLDRSGPEGYGPETDRLELARRFLRCLGPATPDDFAGWTKSGISEARRRWDALAADLVEVSWAGRTGSLLAEDADRLRRAAPVRGARLLPPGDPYLLGRDRETAVAGKADRALLWPSVGSPGAVLVDGELVGVWRAQKKTSTLAVQITTFGKIVAAARSAVAAEAERLAPFRGCRSATVVHTG